jgi:hypothetical protein
MGKAGFGLWAFGFGNSSRKPPLKPVFTTKHTKGAKIRVKRVKK